eukprot:677067-Pyramimonas_sp.AAC.1
MVVLHKAASLRVPRHPWQKQYNVLTGRQRTVKILLHCARRIVCGQGLWRALAGWAPQCSFRIVF